MQTLSDGNEVTSRSYYYLLDWNDWNDWKFMREHFDKQKLRELDISEYQMLFRYATSQEFPIEASTNIFETVPEMLEMLIDPFQRVKNMGIVLGVASHHLPTSLMNNDVCLLESLKRKEYDLFVQENYVYNPERKKSSRVRGEKNKEFKQSIKNLTNNQRK